MEKRWIIVLVASLIHLLLGSVYAWSFFQIPIMQETGWNNTQSTMAFSLTIFVLGFTASWAGQRIEKYGSDRLTMLGGIFFGLGYLISSYALYIGSLWLFYVGFGLVSGLGLGLGYVTPVSVVSRWFDKNQGVATGIVVMGFGLGAFVMSKILAPFILTLTKGNVALGFGYLGGIFLILIPFLGFFLKFPDLKKTINLPSFSVEKRQEISSKNTLWIWLIFTLNIIAGMIFLSFQSPLFQELLKKNGQTNAQALSSAGASLVAFSAFFNGVGRFFWASFSDKLGRIRAFQWLLLVELIGFILLIWTKEEALFFILVCVILLCYGGGFGILPSLVKEEYGVNLMPKMYGKILTGWAVGGLLGTLITAFLKDKFLNEADFYVYCIGFVVILLALICSFLVRKK